MAVVAPDEEAAVELYVRRVHGPELAELLVALLDARWALSASPVEQLAFLCDFRVPDARVAAKVAAARDAGQGARGVAVLVEELEYLCQPVIDAYRLSADKERIDAWLRQRPLTDVRRSHSQRSEVALDAVQRTVRAHHAASEPASAAVLQDMAPPDLAHKRKSETWALPAEPAPTPAPTRPGEPVPARPEQSQQPPPTSVRARVFEYAPQLFATIHRHAWEELGGRELLAPSAALSLAGWRSAGPAVHAVETSSRSGSVYWQSTDGRLFLKTLTAKEARVLRGLLGAYEAHLRAHPASLLPRFVGLFKIRLLDEPAAGSPTKVYICAMINFFFLATRAPLASAPRPSTPSPSPTRTRQSVTCAPVASAPRPSRTPSPTRTQHAAADGDDATASPARPSSAAAACSSSSESLDDSPPGTRASRPHDGCADGTAEAANGSADGPVMPRGRRSCDDGAPAAEPCARAPTPASTRTPPASARRAIEQYDLKGSTVDRSVGPLTGSSPPALGSFGSGFGALGLGFASTGSSASSTLGVDASWTVARKDLDLQRAVRLGPAQRQMLLAQLRLDSALLERHEIMDYSILLGVADGDERAAEARARRDADAQERAARAALWQRYARAAGGTLGCAATPQADGAGADAGLAPLGGNVRHDGDNDGDGDGAARTHGGAAAACARSDERRCTRADMGTTPAPKRGVTRCAGDEAGCAPASAAAAPREERAANAASAFLSEDGGGRAPTAASAECTAPPPPLDVVTTVPSSWLRGASAWLPSAVWLPRSPATESAAPAPSAAAAAAAAASSSSSARR